jgi:hypothetical protein
MKTPRSLAFAASLVATVAAVAGCSTAAGRLREVTQNVSQQLGCPADQLNVQAHDEQTYDVEGCKTELTFTCQEWFGWHCAAPISDTELNHFGSRHYPGTKQAVTEAAANALQAIGYDIAVAEPAKGIVITKRKIIQAVATGTYQATFSYQQFTVKVTDGPEGGATARVTPSFFIGERDMSEKGFNIGEVRKVWKSFFAQMKQLL